MRSHYCGQVTTTLLDQEVTLAGWVHRRRDHGGVIFLDLRDREGIVQVGGWRANDMGPASPCSLVCLPYYAA